MNKYLFLFVIVYCVTKTGSLNAEGTPKTRNAELANENQFPHMVSLQQLSQIHSDTRGHRCGGVLVTQQHALTAAACIIGAVNGQTIITINRDEFRVFAGSVFLTNDTSGDRVRRIADTIIHPEFNLTNSRFLHDIGVIILGTPFLSSTVAQLPIKDIGTTDHVRCTTMGWGRSTQLMHSRITAPNVTMCSILLPLLPNTMCGLPFSNLGCPGDPGSPLVCYDSLVGILINTRGCTANTPVPQMFIRVSNYTTWIDEVIALPIPPVGPEPPTVPPPTTTTTPIPGAASSFHPGITLLALIAVAQIVTAKVMN